MNPGRSVDLRFVRLWEEAAVFDMGKSQVACVCHRTSAESRSLLDCFMTDDLVISGRSKFGR